MIESIDFSKYKLEDAITPINEQLTAHYKRFDYSNCESYNLKLLFFQVVRVLHDVHEGPSHNHEYTRSNIS